MSKPMSDLETSLPEERETDALRWYVLRTMPQHEHAAAKYLQQKGIEHYLPLVARKRKWSDRIKIIEFPLFPGYLFVRIRYRQDYRTVLGFHGNLGFITVEDVPASMSDEEIDSLKYMVQEGQEIQNEPAKLFPPGQVVEINFGDFKGQQGIVKKVKGKTRVTIYLHLLGQRVTAEFDAVELSPVS